MITKRTANKIYDILVPVCKAMESERSGFVCEVTSDNHGCEWRFCGNLGFGGKFYWDCEWRVSCYPEDETPA